MTPGGVGCVEEESAVFVADVHVVEAVRDGGDGLGLRVQLVLEDSVGADVGTEGGVDKEHEAEGEERREELKDQRPDVADAQEDCEGRRGKSGRLLRTAKKKKKWEGGWVDTEAGQAWAGEEGGRRVRGRVGRRFGARGESGGHVGRHAEVAASSANVGSHGGPGLSRREPHGRGSKPSSKAGDLRVRSSVWSPKQLWRFRVLQGGGERGRGGEGGRSLTVFPQERVVLPGEAPGPGALDHGGPRAKLRGARLALGPDESGAAVYGSHRVVGRQGRGGIRRRASTWGAGRAAEDAGARSGNKRSPGGFVGSAGNLSNTDMGCSSPATAVTLAFGGPEHPGRRGTAGP